MAIKLSELEGRVIRGIFRLCIAHICICPTMAWGRISIARATCSTYVCALCCKTPLHPPDNLEKIRLREDKERVYEKLVEFRNKVLNSSSIAARPL
jgi:hypothetical protein